MTVKSNQQPVLESARVLICAERSTSIIDLLTTPDDPGPEVATAADAAMAADQLARRSFDACFIDMDGCRTGAVELIGPLRTANPSTPIVVFTSDEETIRAIGASDPSVE